MNYKDIGLQIGELVTEKQAAYGDAFGKAGKILEVLYPNGIMPHQFQNALAITRVIDKLFRIATNENALDENPWRDIAGYSILSVAAKDKSK